MVLYEGIFFEGDSSKLIVLNERSPLEKRVSNFHCTFKFRPKDEEIFDEIVGEDVNVMVIGYGCDGKNSGYEVVLPGYIQKYYLNYDKNNPEKLTTSHITISLAKGARAVDTKNLEFSPLYRPFVLRGRFGYYISEGKEQYVSYDKYFKSNVKKLIKK